MKNIIIKQINKIIKETNLIYCEVCYDGECEDFKNTWLYDLIIYDTEEKVDNFITQLKQYADITVYKNMDDNDYTIECTIKW